MTNSSTGPRHNILAGTIYTFWNAVALVGYVFVVLALVRHRYAFKHSFYVLIGHLAAADVGYLMVNFGVMVPQTFAGRQLYGRMGTILAAGNTFFFYTTLFTTFMISLNRFCVFFLPFLNELFFSKRRVKITMLIPWILSVIILIATTLLPCPKKFQHFRFHFYFACSQGASVLWLIYLGQFLTILMICMYVLLYLKLKVQGRRSTLDEAQRSATAKMERRLLYQGMLISLILGIEILAFFLVPKIVRNFMAPIITSSMGAINCLKNPIIYVVYNKLTRAKMLGLVGIETHSVTAAASTLAQSAVTRAKPKTDTVALEATQKDTVPNAIEN